MDDIHFERHFRTPYSEGYYIMQGNGLQSNNRLGTIDIHFTTTAVHGTLILERELEETGPGGPYTLHPSAQVSSGREEGVDRERHPPLHIGQERSHTRTSP